MARAGCWNHNVQYQPVILGAVPPGCGAAARSLLPGVRYRRHLPWRYSLLWRKPSG
jgi:hypothetical protein